ncbi:hypothetical protein AB0M54_16435 [Actinoplanes sp. NPDC051470]|uniref:hypothetical protein n=1 Tax=Actinoplanes sp. NPDC051470 TaxID=3157224 RepID=UPI00342B0076
MMGHAAWDGVMRGRRPLIGDHALKRDLTVPGVDLPFGVASTIRPLGAGAAGGCWVVVGAGSPRVVVGAGSLRVVVVGISRVVGAGGGGLETPVV